MKKNKLLQLLATALSVVFLLIFSSCVSPRFQKNICTVALQTDGEISCPAAMKSVKRGEDAVFYLSVDNGFKISDVECSNYTLTVSSRNESFTEYVLTVHAVRYSAFIKVSASPASFTSYYPNGGDGEAIEESATLSHLRANSLIQQGQFSRKGYVQVGWNTQADGSGEYIGFGSRYEETPALYAEWAKESDSSLFKTEETPLGNLKITQYIGGDAELLVLPQYINGKKVSSIGKNAFKDIKITSLVLHENVSEIEEYGFYNCDIENICFFDSLNALSENAFFNCNFTRFYLNAATMPKYSGNYFDSFADKFDRLLSLKGCKKMVLAGGSSARFGYDSPTLKEAFPEYEVVNMGVYAYSNMSAQLELILNAMESGDLLIHGTEFDAIDEQFTLSRDLPYEIFAMCEGNYGAISLLDMNNYENETEAYRLFSLLRESLPDKSYGQTVYSFDEDGNYSSLPVYNKEGDYILYRENNEEMKNFGVKRAYYNKKYVTEEHLSALNSRLDKFLNKGIEVVYTYTPRMNNSLADSTEDSIRELDLYLRENLRVPVISDIWESLYSPLYFHSTDNHLSTEGVKIRTERVIADLKAYFEEGIK